nr:hypothetical protein [uncultured Cupriavidus sp.]
MVEEPQKNGSIFDFLYTDHERLKSWLAQTFPDGIPHSSKKTSVSGANSGLEIGGSADVTGQVSAVFAKSGVKGGAQGKMSSNENASRSHEQTFDNSWALPVDVLDVLQEQGYIQRDLRAAQVGSLVLVSGAPQLIDIKFMQDIWDPAITHLTSQEKVTHKNKHQIVEVRSQLKNIGDLLRVMPPYPQMTLVDIDGNQVWACLKQEHLLISSSALALAHGSFVRETWHVLAAVDALPDEQVEHATTPPPQQSQLMAAAAEIIGQMRDLMGRSSTAYAVTPVLIFRAINPLPE